MKPISELVGEFLGEQDVNRLSRDTYKSAIAQFLRWVVVSKLDFWKIKKFNIIQYKDSLLKSGESLYTVDLYMTVVRKFFQWLEDQGLSTNVTLGVRSPKKRNSFRKGYLKVDQVKRLLDSIDRDSITGKRDFAMISLMVRAGFRRVEICRMTIGDVRNGEPITIRLQRKGHLEKDVEVGITGKMLETIHDYIICRGDLKESDYLFVSHARGYKETNLNPVMVSRIVKRRLREIGLDSRSLTCHSLRHTAAILSLKAGATIYDVQQMLGHVSIETTKIYLRAIEEETRINNRAVHTLDELF